jgi:CRISPR/Cas system-associated protein Cas10 (large subunit of type III CRISPR-Cas system)
MAKLLNDIAEAIWNLQQQLAEIIENAKSAEFSLFSRFGETERTTVYLDELQNVAEQASERFSRFSTLQLRVANVQPQVPPNMLELVIQVIANTQARLPALERSVQEIKAEWSL